MNTGKPGSILGVAFLVAGTCIGGGMLALPVITSSAGFLPSLGLMAIACAFMAFTGLLFVEANLWIGPGAHFLTMADRLLGPIGKIVTALLYLFIGYCSLIAYTAGGGGLIVELLFKEWGIDWGKWPSYTFFTALFIFVIALGHRSVGRINGILFVAMIIAYLFLIVGGVGEVNPHLLFRQDWTFGIYSVPLLLTIFSYQGIVPSLVIYMNGDGKRLKLAIILGASIAFVVYALWQWLVMGIVPLEGPHGLDEALRLGLTSTQLLEYFVVHKGLILTSQFFAFFALVTSFLGIGLGLFDFLVDGFKVRRRGISKGGILLLIAVPSLCLSIYYPRAFISALNVSGGFGDAILNGIIPVLMVWSGRYIKRLSGDFKVRGRAAFLFVIFVFALFVLVIEILEQLHLLVPVDDLRAVIPDQSFQG